MSSPEGSLSRDRLPKQSRRLRLIVGVILAALVLGYLPFSLTKPYIETELYFRAAERMMQGDTIHRTDERAFSYPPLFALVFVPLALLPQVLHRPVWYLLNVAILGFILYRLKRLLARVLPEMNPGGHADQLARTRKVWLFWGLLATLSARHLFAVVENQSHDFLVMLCVLLAIEAWCAMRDKTAGFWAGVGAALKATPLLFAPVLLWHRKWVGFAVLVAALAGFTFLPDLLYPPNNGTSWTVQWYQTFLTGVQPGESPSLQNTWPTGTKLNQSLAGTMHRLFTPPPEEMAHEDVSLLALDPTQRKVVTLLVQLAALAWLAWMTRPRLTRQMPVEHQSWQRFGEGVAVATAMVLLSPTSIKTHFCVLLFPLAFCLADFLWRRRDPITGAALVAAFVLGTMTAKDILGVALGDRILSYGSLTAMTLALFFANGWILLQNSRQYRFANRHERSGLAPVELNPAQAA